MMTNLPTEKSQSQTIELHDQDQVAALLSVGFDIVGTRWEGERLYYVFLDTGGARSVLTAFVTGDLQLKASVAFEGARKARQILSKAIREKRGG